MRTLKTISSFFLFVSVSLMSWSYPSGQIDSLIIQLKLLDSDSIKYNLLEDIETKLDELDKELEMNTWNSIIEYCEQEKYYKGLGFCYYNLAVRLKNEGEYIKALNAYTESKKNYEKCDFESGMASVENGLGILYKELNRFEQSLTHYTESARLFMKLKDSVRVGWIYLNLGGMMETQDSLTKAKIYLRKSQNILKKLADPNIISCYINLGEVFNKENNYDSAYYYYLKGYELSKIKGELTDKFQAVYHYGEFLFIQNGVDEAEPYLLEVLEIVNSNNTFNFLPIDDREDFSKLMSNYYDEKGDFDSD